MFSPLNIKQWLLVGFLIRFAVMPFTFHSDILYLYNTPHFLMHGEWDAYGVRDAYGIIRGYYPPLTLLIFAAVQFFLTTIFPDFEPFLHSISLLTPQAILESESLFQSIFLMKLPFILFEIILIKALWKVLPDPETKKIFIVSWIINPLPIYAIYMLGKFDLLPTLMVVIAFLFSTHKGKEHLAYLSLGLGFLLKFFPIIFFPLLLCLNCKTIKSFFRYSIYCFMPIILLYGATLWVSGSAALALFTNFLTQHPVTSSSSFPTPFLAIRLFQLSVYALICAHIFYFQKLPVNNNLAAKYFLIIYLAFFLEVPLSSTHQFVWMLPFLLFWVGHNRKRLKFFHLFIIIIFLGGLKARSHTLGILAPLNPQFFLSLPSLKGITGFLLDQNTYELFINYLFKAVSVILIFSIFKFIYKKPIPS